MNHFAENISSFPLLGNAKRICTGLYLKETQICVCFKGNIAQL